MEYKTGKEITKSRHFLTLLRRGLVLILSPLFIILLSSQVSTSVHLSGSYMGQLPPGTRPERFAPGIIPDDLHSAPVFTADGKCIYYKTMDNEGIMFSMEKNSTWSSPSLLFSNNEVENSDDPCLDPAGERLFFSSYNKSDNREYIYFCELDGEGKYNPCQPGGELNSLDLHWQFRLAENGNIYFSSNGNIYCSELSNKVYQTPYKLDSIINTQYSECTPYISPDEKTLIFARANGGKPDLYISRRGNHGAWQTAIALGPSINTEFHEMCPRITADGKYFFFLSSKEGLFSAYWADISVLELAQAK